MSDDDLPHISVVIPTHKRPDSLARCVRSIFAQTYPASLFDIHIVHNQAEDGTAELVEILRRESPVAMEYTRKNGRGPAPSRHFGGMGAKGELIAFIDDDCEATPDWLRAGMGAFADGMGFVQGATLPNPAHKRQLFEKTVNVPKPSPFFETCNIFYRKSAFVAVDGFSGPFADRFYGEDTDLGRRTLKAGYKAGFCTEAIVYHDITAQPLHKWLMECWHLQNLPLLVKCWPEMRQSMFLGLFLNPQTAAFDLGVLGLLAAPTSGGWTLLCFLPFFFVRLLEPGRYRNPLAVVGRAAFGLPRACVTFAALVTGSCRHRSPLL